MNEHPNTRIQRHSDTNSKDTIFYTITYARLYRLGVMNGPLRFLTAQKILPLLDLLAKFKRVLACSCSPNFCFTRKLAKQIFYFCSCSKKSRSARHARECSQRPFVTPQIVSVQMTIKASVGGWYLLNRFIAHKSSAEWIKVCIPKRSQCPFSACLQKAKFT